MAKVVTQKLGPKQKAWVKALRSGKYKQGCGVLVTSYDNIKDNQYCCLGVLCEMKGKLTTNGYVKGTGNNSVLPQLISDELHFYDTDGTFRNFSYNKVGKKAYASLVDANDNGATFEQIADFIENNPSIVFKKSV